jgi:hypothetical protein
LAFAPDSVVATNLEIRREPVQVNEYPALGSCKRAGLATRDYRITPNPLDGITNALLSQKSFQRVDRFVEWWGFA